MTKDDVYVNEIMEAHQLIRSNLFRPPYGKITQAQAKLLRKQELGMKELGIGDDHAIQGLLKAGIEKQEPGIRNEVSIGNNNHDYFSANQTSDISHQAFQIIMWSVIAGDFDEKIDGDVCYHHVVKYTKPGSIIVFHDSQKAFPRLKTALPKTLEWLVQQGFQMEVIK